MSAFRADEPEGIEVEYEYSWTVVEQQPTNRDVLDSFRAFLKSRSTTWLTPGPGPHNWVLDLDALRAAFQPLDALGWLKGTIRVDPVVEKQEREDPFADLSKGSWRPRYRDFDCKAYFVVSRDDVENVTGVPGVPLDLRQSLQRFRGDFPNPDKAAFLIMRFGSTPAHRQIVDAVRSALTPYGVTAVRADDKTYHDDILGNIRTYMHGCAFGIAVFERIEQETFNPNVSFEVGYLMALGKPVCLLKDKNLNTLHADLIGKIYIPFDPFEPQASIASQVGAWLRDKSPSAAIAKSP
jgi:hypothetical protein